MAERRPLIGELLSYIEDSVPTYQLDDLSLSLSIDEILELRDQDGRIAIYPMELEYIIGVVGTSQGASNPDANA